LQFSTVEDIPKEYFTENKVIYGRVERVIDGDTIRVAHCPTYFSCPERDTKQGLADTTIKVRLYGVDCPELQKKKSDPSSQPFAKEATAFTSSIVLDKTVEIKLLNKDKYGRAISKVQAGPLDLSPELVQRGFATMYTGKGAEYDGNKKLLESIQEQAKKRKTGIWSFGDNMVSPADFKRQQNRLQQKAQLAPVL
jgi:endonuclease YncB( thermonuclease family)